MRAYEFRRGGRRWALSGLMAVAAVAAASPSPVSAGQSSVKGGFDTVTVSAPECTSPVGLCMAGTLSGGLKGDYSFVASSVISTADSPSTGVVMYTGDAVIETKGGTLFCKDAGVLATAGTGRRPLSSVCTVTGGTGELAGTSGQLQFRGRYSTADGGSGDYIGDLVTP